MDAAILRPVFNGSRDPPAIGIVSTSGRSSRDIEMLRYLFRRPAIVLACLLAVSALPLPAAAGDAPPAAAHNGRPRVALVLSGGGARGLAHIGVLRVLHEMRVPVDIVVGTSMGAVVGGAYASGRTVEDLERFVRDTQWDAVLADRPTRDSLDFRRREEDLLLPSRLEFAVTREDGITLPPGAASNASIEAALLRLLPPGLRDHPVNQLPLPFRSIASDLVNGELVELSDTSVFLAMRASLAVPGVFAPVRVNGRLLADGGLVRNLPVDMARAMGADIVIAVNVGTPLAPEKDLNSAIGVARQMLQILTEQNVQRSLRELGPNDILIAPDLGGVSFLDFQRGGRAIQAGEEAARQVAAQLQRLAVPAEAHAAFEARRRGIATPTPATPRPLVAVTVDGTKHINPKTVLAQTGLAEGQLVTPDQIRQSTARLYGRGDLDNVDTEIYENDDGHHVIVRPKEASWSRNRLRAGLELASDFGDNNRFSLGMMHVASSLNSYGAELRTVARIGSDRLFGMQLWQPLGPGSPWFVTPSIEYGGSATNIYSGGMRTSRFGVRASAITLAAGRELANWGDVQLGVSRRSARLQSLIPEAPPGEKFIVYDTTQFARLRIDTLDSLAYPSRGQLLNVLVERSPSSEQEGRSLAHSSVTGLAALQVGQWAGHLYGEWARASDGPTSVSLGGFLRLSGTPADSLDGGKVAFARYVMARRIGTMPATVGGAVRLGFSMELGGGFARGESIKFGQLKRAGSLFLSADTRFGPLYFGAGATRGVGSTFYLFLGPIW